MCLIVRSKAECWPVLTHSKLCSYDNFPERYSRLIADSTFSPADSLGMLDIEQNPKIIVNTSLYEKAKIWIALIQFGLSKRKIIE